MMLGIDDISGPIMANMSEMMRSNILQVAICMYLVVILHINYLLMIERQIHVKVFYGPIPISSSPHKFYDQRMSEIAINL